MSRFLKVLAGGVLGIAVLAGAYFAFQTGIVAGAMSMFERKNEFVPPPPPEVTYANPVRQKVADYIEFTGTTRATARVDLRAQVSGKLKAINFNDGDLVEAGQVLFEIESAPFDAEVLAADAQLQKAQANLQLAKANLDRITTLYHRNVATKQEYDVQVAEKATAAAEVAVAEAAKTKAVLEQSYTKIEAPIAGRIGRHLVDIGNLVQAEQTLLATIESIHPIHAYFYLSERELLRFMEMLRQDKLPDPEASPPKLQMGLANEEGFPHTGTLDYREFGVDPDTGTIARRAVFQNPDNILIPGLFVRLRAKIGEAQYQWLIEEQALGSDQKGDFLLIVGEEDKIEKRYVELGISVEDMRVILEGLEGGERVVVNGLQRALPNAQVTPKELIRPEQPESPTTPAESSEEPIADSEDKTPESPKPMTRPVATAKEE